MKTIVFVDKDEGELWDAYERHSYLLDEWLHDEDVVICPWHRDGRTVATALPDLERLLGDVEEWEALVVCDLRDKGDVDPQLDESFGNPFDFPEYYEVDFTQPIVESERPIIRLTQMLGGIPDRVAMVPRELSTAVGELDSDSWYVNAYDLRHPRSEDFFDLQARYRLGLPRPKRITCITPRVVDADLAHELAARRQLEDHSHAERFWERNAYATGTRFVAFDFDALAESEYSDAPGLESTLAERKWLEFWCAVVAFSLNEFSPNDLQAYRLYSLSVTLDSDELRRLVSQQEAVWSAAQDLIEARLAQEEKLLQRSEFEIPEIPQCQTSIHVEFDEEGFGGLQCDSSLVGPLRDLPKNDRVVWDNQYAESFKHFKELLWTPVREVRKAVIRYRSQHTLPPEELEYCILNQRVFEDLIEQQRDAEEELVSTLTATPFDFRTYQSGIEARGDEVVARIEARSSALRSIAALLWATLALFLGLAPGVLAVQSSRDRVTSGFSVVCACILVAFVGILTIMRQRRAIRDAYGSFNKNMGALCNSFGKERDRLGRRISAYATMQKRAQIMDRQSMGGVPTRRIMELREKRARILEQTKRLDQLVGSHRSIDRQVYRLTLARGWGDLARKMEDDDFFKIRIYRPTRKPFNMSKRHGGMVTVPFPFISEVSLVPLSLCTYAEAAKGGDSC